MNQLTKQKCVMIIAGEASGDLHGSKVVKAMRDRDAGLFFCGIGGQALKDAGVKILADSSRLAVVGITEALAKMPYILKGMALAKRLLKTLHPDLLILIDFPDFNLHIAATAKKIGIPVLYYISPQVWAWRPGRVKKIGKRVDQVAVILPFEVDFYKKFEIPVTFVGHPLLDTDFCPGDKTSEKQIENLPAIGFLPGSRDKEIARHLPVMLDAAGIMRQRIENVTFIISLAPSVKKKHVEKLLKKHEPGVGVELISERVEKVLKRCRLVVAASGTVTLEAAIFGTPMVIIYKVSPVSYFLGKIMVRVKNIGLVNLIAGREIVPELLQGKASPENIADTVLNMLSDPNSRKALRNDILGVRDALGGSGASKRVADIALNILQGV